ncbi:MAG: polyphosphate kinase 2 family protein [Acidimicrobiia bacterium]|nr:polyphosphate kinase 2 family protein [Acidimicrobiia bacterium]
MPGRPVRLDDLPTRGDDWVDGDPEVAKSAAQDANGTISARLGELQERLHATKAAKVLVVLQGMDTSGKDSTTRRVFGDGSPLGIRAVPFGRPTEVERAHDFLWRVHAAAPADGEIVVFNRSHYEDVLVVRIDELVPAERWERRFDHLVDFERMLVDEGTVVRKFFLHISRDEQHQRLQDRLDDPTKHWKFESGDLDARARWDNYQRAYEEAIARTSTDVAPWYVVPADQKWFRDLVVGSVVLEALEALDMRWPEPPEGLEHIVIPD